MYKQSKYPTTDEWIHKIWCIHTMEYYFTIERTEVIDTCNNIDKHWKHYTKCKEPVTKTMLYDSLYKTDLDLENLWRQNAD